MTPELKDEALLQASERVVAERDALLRALQETHE